MAVEFKQGTRAVIKVDLDDIDKQALTFLSVFKDNGLPDSEIVAVISRLSFWLNSGVSDEDLAAIYKKLYSDDSEGEGEVEKVDAVSKSSVAPDTDSKSYGYRTGK